MFGGACYSGRPGAFRGNIGSDTAPSGLIVGEHFVPHARGRERVCVEGCRGRGESDELGLNFQHLFGPPILAQGSGLLGVPGPNRTYTLLARRAGKLRRAISSGEAVATTVDDGQGEA